MEICFFAIGAIVDVFAKAAEVAVIFLSKEFEWCVKIRRREEEFLAVYYAAEDGSDHESLSRFIHDDILIRNSSLLVKRSEALIGLSMHIMRRPLIWS